VGIYHWDFTIPCLLSAWGRDEGALGSNYFLNAFANLFGVIGFPVHTLFLRFISDKYFTIFFFGGLFIDILFYGFIMERLISLFKKN
jgi:hypothetical protein